MPKPTLLTTVLQAVRQLGFTQVALNALYRVGLKTGYFKIIGDIRNSKSGTTRPSIQLSNIGLSIPSQEQLLNTIGPNGLQTLLAEADEIVEGQFRQFGGAPVAIQLSFSKPLVHWTAYETNHILLSDLYSPFTDIKLIWEPARFGWAFVLGRAYHASGDEKYAEAFWRFFETFQAGNPVNKGPNWMSGQEVGIRLMAFVWAGAIFGAAKASTPERLAHLATAVAQHAARIPSTLLYARSQNNNHLLTEAAALYTASRALPRHPASTQWQALGEKWLTWCFTHQIDRYGEYVQHSANYHRLMLQTALWVRTVDGGRWTVDAPTVNGLPSTVQQNLALATHWLLSLLDSGSGRVPNLGANDGALIFPLSTQPFEDFRPVAQAAARSFLGYSLAPGPWDEMSLWFGVPTVQHLTELPRYPGDHLYLDHSWGYLRAVKLTSRPSHADQLHFDLWWRGLNIAQDAGTYLYNAEAPWDNRLTSTLVHNTVSVDGQEQMTRVGRFLYLDWADAKSKRHFESGADFIQRASAQTDAYAARFGIQHTRTVTAFDEQRWQIEDDLQNPLSQPHIFRLHWLLPDWEWKIESSEERIEISLKSPAGWVSLHITFQPSNLQPVTHLVRAGEYVYGTGPADPVRGWVSPTYAQKLPALSLAIEVESVERVKFISEFVFPTVDGGQ